MCDGNPFASSLFRNLTGRGLSLQSFLVQFALSGSMPDLTGLSASKKRRFSVRMRSLTRHLVVPLLCRPMAWEKASHIDAKTANREY